MDELNDLMPISPDHNRERLDTLKQLFPDLFTNEGKLNPEELKKLVSGELVSETERYEFRWQGKSASKRTAFTPSRAALVYDPARSVNPDKAGGNMIIEGENLETLKLLTSAYRERIKCIYIDPPYNTGKDFVYSDNFAKDKKAYWEETGATEEGVKVDTNSDASGRYHSDWLSMMHSRLLVARQLLRDDGVIFVSIDDNEVHNLRKLMDEVFGEENFIANIVWQKTYSPANDKVGIDDMHDYVMCYQKGELASINLLPRTEKQDNAYSNPDNDARGPWKAVDSTRAEHRDYAYYPIVTPKGNEVYPAKGRSWIFTKEELPQLVAENLLWFGKDGSSKPSKKLFLTDVKQGIVPTTWWAHEDAGHNDQAKKELKTIFPEKMPFETPKPSKLIQRILQLSTNPKDEHLCMDFFAGSGTSAQAVLNLNKTDGGNRRFILVQIPESIKETEEAYKAGFKKITDITIERVKRVINGREGELPFDEAGFKVYKLTKSSFPRVEFAPDPDKTPAENVELLKAYILEKETAFHIAFEKEKIFDEVLLKNGFMLDYTLTQQEQFTANTVYLVKDTCREALLCLDVPIDMATVDYFKEHKEQRFICLEQALDTTRKWNLKHHLGDKFVAF